MKKSERPTENLLLRAYTTSEWDECEFAIIHCTEQWKEQLKKRREAVKAFADDINFQSLNFYDTDVDFYQSDGEKPDLNALLGEDSWAYVELEKDEQESLQAPENQLDCYVMVVFRNGIAYYKAFGKHTHEEFYTDDFGFRLLENGEL